MDSIYFQFERLRYREGQMLRSRDLNDQAALNAEIRWWHNRALHRVFGVRDGLRVSPITDATGQLIGLHVSEGIAYDCFGRELLLCPGGDITLPEHFRLQGLLLLLRRRQTRSRAARKRPECAPVSGRQPETELVWKLPGQCETADGVPLARISLQAGKPGLDRFFAWPIAHALARPRVAHSITVPGTMVWEEFSLIGQIANGIQTHVDTTPAGFVQTPVYFAWLAPAETGGDDDDLIVRLLSLPADIAEATSTGFTFRILSPRRLVDRRAAKVTELARSFALRARKLGMRVCWLGCEHTPEAPVCREVCDCRQSAKETATPSQGRENHHAH